MPNPVEDYYYNDMMLPQFESVNPAVGNTPGEWTSVSGQETCEEQSSGQFTSCYNNYKQNKFPETLYYPDENPENWRKNYSQFHQGDQFGEPFNGRGVLTSRSRSGNRFDYQSNKYMANSNYDFTRPSLTRFDQNRTYGGYYDQPSDYKYSSRYGGSPSYLADDEFYGFGNDEQQENAPPLLELSQKPTNENYFTQPKIPKRYAASSPTVKPKSTPSRSTKSLDSPADPKTKDSKDTKNTKDTKDDKDDNKDQVEGEGEQETSAAKDKAEQPSKTNQSPGSTDSAKVVSPKVRSYAPIRDTIDSEDDCDTFPFVRANQRENTVFIKGFKYQVTKTDLREFFAECGEVTKVVMPRSRKTGRSRRIAWVTFSNQEGVQEAIKKNGETLLTKAVSVCVAEPSTSSLERPRTVKTPPSKKYHTCSVRITNLPSDITIEQLSAMFLFAGTIKGVRITNKNPRGCVAYIEFSDTVSAHKATEMHGRYFSGRRFHVSFARSKKNLNKYPKSDNKFHPKPYNRPSYHMRSPPLYKRSGSW